MEITTTKDLCGAIFVEPNFTIQRQDRTELNAGSSGAEFRSDTQNFTVMADASGGKTPYTYAVYYKLASESKWTTLKDFNSTANTAFNPPYMGDYDICVKVKDGTGTIVKKFIDVKVNAGLTSKSKVSSKSITKGQKVTMTGAATGGSGNYTYAYYYKQEDAAKWGGFSFSSAKSKSFKPIKETTYNVCIKVKDGSGTAEGIHSGRCRCRCNLAVHGGHGSYAGLFQDAVQGSAEK